MINQVSQTLLAPYGLDQKSLLNIFDCFNDSKVEYSDIFFQLSIDESWSLEDSIIKEGGFYIDKGASIRAVNGDKTGFAYTDQISFENLKRCAITSGAICKNLVSNHRFQCQKEFISQNIIKRYPAINPLNSLTNEQKVELLHLIDKTARAEDPRVSEVNASLGIIYEEILVVGTDGTFEADIRPLIRLSISVLVEQSGKCERGSCSGGVRSGLEFFFEEDISGEIKAVAMAKEAVRQALVNLSAKTSPSGTMPVVLGAGWPAVLLHEAVGHGLEGDFHRKESSVFTNKIGQQVTSELCTIIDDGTITQHRGSISVDDEGVPSQKNILVENGILKGCLQDKMNARLMGEKPTGNGRRESFAHLPMPRMTNTYLQNGNSEFEAMIESVKYGIYAPNFSGGQVDITSGQFVFSTSEAYLIENGKIKYPITGSTLIGSGIEVMNNISMVGNNFKFDSGIGTCGKDGQTIPVGVGQPCVKVDAITVGGRG